MHHLDYSPCELPGYKKKSFSMFFGGGEIYFEHLDGIYQYEELVLEKLSQDMLDFCRPSVTSLICFNLDETTITDKIRMKIIESLSITKKRITRVCFIGIDKKNAKIIKNSLSGKGFCIAFENDFEKAKQWLVSSSFI